MIRYVFSDSPLTIKGSAKADPQVIGDALEKIRSANDGRIQPKAVVESARSQKNPLHKHFEWDNSVAAESFRLEQARELIRCVRIVDTDVKRGNVQAFVSVKSESGVNYHAVRDVQNSVTLRYAVLIQAEKDLDAWEKRYKELREICSVVAGARQMIKRKREGESRPTV
jgi:hypothetical protein